MSLMRSLHILLCRIALLAVLTALLTVPAISDSYGERPIDSLYTGADVVAVIRIVGAESAKRGVVYRAEVQRGLKGCDSGDVVFFGPYIWRKVGARYLVFLNFTHIKIGDLLPKPLTSVRGALWPHNRTILSERNYEGMGTMDIEYKLLNERDPSTWGDWVEVPFAVFTIPSNIPTIAKDSCLTIENAFQDYWVQLGPLLSYFESAKNWYGTSPHRDPDGVANTRSCMQSGYWSARVPARTVHLTDSMPTKALSSVQNKLRGRVGSALIGRLRLMHMLALESAPSDKRVKIDTASLPRYRFVYRYQDSSAGLYQFCIAIETDSNGVIKDSIRFPNSRNTPSKARLFPLPKAIAAARRNGMRDEFSVGIEYSVKYDALIWEFVWYDELSRSDRFKLLLDAHTGKELEFSSDHGFSSP